VSEQAQATVVALPERRSPAAAAFVALRPRQWPKTSFTVAASVTTCAIVLAPG
jgi:hypothetical protein